VFSHGRTSARECQTESTSRASILGAIWKWRR
jgi:hypothetical protein